VEPDVFAKFLRLRVVPHRATDDVDLDFSVEFLKSLEKSRWRGTKKWQWGGFGEAIIDNDESDFERVGHGLVLVLYGVSES
jgi:hypothetical protein